MTRYIPSAVCVPSASPEYSISDLKWTSVLEFRAVGTGKFYQTKSGTMREKLVGKDFVHTAAAGVLELNEWYRLMDEAVKREGLEPLLDRIVEFVMKKMPAYYDPKNTRHNPRYYALECLSDGVYKAWGDFKEVG